MTIGERIKQLRKKNDLTQEKLADYLCVSYQAVSKWECGLSSPDLGLIVPLAKLLNVTTDELLGAISENSDKRYAELKTKYDETFQSGDLLMRLNVCEAAVKEYLGDADWLNNYAWAIWCSAIGNKSCEQERETAIKLFNTVIENTNKMETKAHAITGIVQCLCGKGCKQEAKKYVDLLPEIKNLPFDKNKLLGMCLEGKEKLQHTQQYLEEYTGILIRTLLWNGIAENEHACIAAEEILKAMIPDENYCHYHYEMAHIQFRKSESAAKAGHLHEALSLLKKSVYHAREYDFIDTTAPGEYAFTAPLFNRLTIDSRKWCHTGSDTLFDDIKNMCNRKSFDKIRNLNEYDLLFKK